MTMQTGSHRQAEVDWARVDTAAADDDVVVSRIKQGTRKRLYEHGEGELDRDMDKMYKRDYWEDPAYVPLLELSGLLLARAEAVLCFSDRAHSTGPPMPSSPSGGRSGSAAAGLLMSRSQPGPRPPAKVVCSSVSGDQSWTT